MLVAAGGLDEYDALWGMALKYGADRINNQVFEDGREPYTALTGQETKLTKNDHVFGAATTFHVPVELRKATKWKPSGNKAIWVGKSSEVKEGAVVVPVEWDTTINAWMMGKPKHVSKAAVEDDELLLREGPSGFTTASVQKFDEQGNLAKSKVSPPDATFQDNEGRDPVMDVEKIVGHKGKGRKIQYRVRWVGHKEETYEPLSNLGGAKKLVKEYEASLQQERAAQKEKPKRTLAAKRASRRGATHVQQKDATGRAVEELLNKQKQKVTVNDWRPGYEAELEGVKRRRLRKVTTEEELQRARKLAVPMRMNLEPKNDGRKKARLIVQGFREPPSWTKGPTDSPVAALSTVRGLLFMGWLLDTVISSIDVTTAFLQSDKYGEHEEARYVSYRPYRGAVNEYYQLLGPLYGQKEASQRWYDTIKTWLVKEEQFVQGENDPCIFIKDNIKVVLYVDDILVRGTRSATTQFYDGLARKFDVKDPTYLTTDTKLTFLGFDIRMREDGANAVISMDQETAVNRFLDTWGVPYTKGIKCPMPDTQAMWSDMTRLTPREAQDYQRMVGSLNYFACTTRYDIAHSVSRLGQMAANPTVGAGQALLRVMRYLRANDSLSLDGEKTCFNKLEVYSDSDVAGDRPIFMRSQTGSIVLLNGTPIQWVSKKQVRSTATSSATAEIYALSETVRTAQLTVWRLRELGVKTPEPVVVQVDNQQAISFQRNTCLLSKMRGIIDMRWAWVKELRDKKKVKVLKVDTESNKADIFTKCLPAYKFHMRMRAIRGDQEKHRMAQFVEEVMTMRKCDSLE
jgi:hypothetical protein